MEQHPFDMHWSDISCTSDRVTLLQAYCMGWRHCVCSYWHVWPMQELVWLHSSGLFSPWSQNDVCACICGCACVSKMCSGGVEGWGWWGVSVCVCVQVCACAQRTYKYTHTQTHKAPHTPASSTHNAFTTCKELAASCSSGCCSSGKTLCVCVCSYVYLLYMHVFVLWYPVCQHHCGLFSVWDCCQTDQLTSRGHHLTVWPLICCTLWPMVSSVCICFACSVYHFCK